LAKNMEEKRERFFRLLPDIDDTTLVVLKGHLLIEEHLNDILYDACALPQYVDKTRLTFYQKIMLTRGLIGQNIQGNETEDPWKSLEVLNSLRNQLAHKLEPSDLDDQIDRFIFARFEGRTMVAFTNTMERVIGLKRELCFLAGYLEGFWIARKSAQRNVPPNTASSSTPID
jgi:hypothetical protein